MANTLWLELTGTPVEQRWVDAGGVPTRALVTGTEHEDVLLLLHGTGGHAEAYVRNLPAHAAHFRTYALDLVGHGYTAKPLTLDYEIDDYVEHVLDFMDAEGIGSAHLSGESLGGWVAGRLAARHPGRVRRLVLNTAGGLTLDAAVMGRIRDLTLAAVREPSEAVVRARLEWLMADPARVTDELVLIRQAIYRQPDLQAVIEKILCLQDAETRRRNLFTEEELGRIKAPTLVLWTSHDPTAAVTVGERFRDLVPNARMRLMDDCGHWPQWENPGQFDQIHIDFLRAE